MDSTLAVADKEVSAAPARIQLQALMPIATLLLSSTIFWGMNWPSVGIDWWFLSFVCLVPWVVFLVSATGRRSAYAVSYLLGVCFYLLNTSCIWVITKPGYFALCLFFGLSYFLFAVILRSVFLRWRIPLALLVPLAWVATEYLRGVGPVALPFLFLSHGVYKQLPLIQISDLVGAYGVSFVIAMVNGLIADWIVWKLKLTRATVSSSRRRGATWATLLVIGSTLLYGVVQLNRQTMNVGPKVAVLQADYPLLVDGGGRSTTTPGEKARVYFDLMDQAASEQPDLFLLPETPWDMVLNDEFLDGEEVDSRYLGLRQASIEFERDLRDRADQYDAHIVIGAASIEFFPLEVYPKSKKYNSAFVYSPRSDDKGRYDKVALVMFGEYTPFRYGALHPVYRWLDGFNPFSTPEDEFSLTPGETFSTFEMSDRADQKYRFGVPICFEDLIPRVSRSFAFDGNGQKRVDFLLSISNDGWFDHAAAVPQHLAVCAFRAVENRVGIARSVNTVCSGFIDPTGRIHDVVSKDGRTLGRGIFGFSVANIMIDGRGTLYSRYGDWFGLFCTAVAGMLWLISRTWRGDKIVFADE